MLVTTSGIRAMLEELDHSKMSSARIEVEKFNGYGDYVLWKEKLMAHLEILGLVDAINTEAVVPVKKKEGLDHVVNEAVTDAAEKSLLYKQRRARSTIILSVSDHVLHKIIKEKTAKGMSQVLDNHYMSKSLSSRIHLKQKLYGYAMSSTQLIERNVDEFLKIIADLENVDVLISDEDQAVMYLMSLPRQFDGLKDTLRYSKLSLTLTDVVTAIKSKELESEIQVKSPKKSLEALFVKGKGNSKGSKYEGKSQSSEAKNKYVKEKNKPKKFCWSCGEHGHFKMQRPKRGNYNGRGSYQHGETAMVNGNDVVRVDMLYVGEALNMTDSDLETQWVIDSGCSFHMTWRKDSFIELDESVTGTFRMANDTVSRMMGLS